jgi:hypothetical protein
MPGRVATPSRRPPASGAPVGGLERLLEPEAGGHSSLADALESRRRAPAAPAVSEEASGGALQVLLIITLVLLVGTGAAVLLVPGGLDFLRSILR